MRKWNKDYANSFIQEKQHYVDFPVLIAKKASRLNAGESVIFNSEGDEAKILNKFWADTRGQEILRKGLFTMSLFGRVVFFLSKDKHDNVKLCYTRNPWESRVGRINEKEEVAEIFYRPNTSDSATLTKIQITKEKYVITPMVEMEVRAGSTTTEMVATTEPIVVPHDFNELPFIELENEMIPNFYGATFFGIPDWWPSIDLMNFYQETTRIKNVEIKSNRTRIGINATNEQLRQMIDNGGHKALEDVSKDSVINSMFSNRYANGMNQSTFELMTGDPKLEAYSNELNWLEEKIYSNVGYTPFKATQGQQYENKTASLFVDKLDIETTQFKQSYIKEKLYKLFDIILEMNGFSQKEERTYSFDIVPMNMIDKVKQYEEFQMGLEMGIISKAEARAELKNISIAQAKKDIEEIEKLEEEQMKKDLEMTQAMNQQLGANDTLGAKEND